MKAFLRANWDRALGAGLVVLGAVALVLGWFGISDKGLAAEQNPYIISGGLAGIALVALGCTAWLSADLQDEWRRLDAIEARLGELIEVSTELTEPSELEPSTAVETRPTRRRPRRRAQPEPAAQ